MIYAIAVQKVEEQKQKNRNNRSAAASEIEKNAEELWSLEFKYGPYFAKGYEEMMWKTPVTEKRAKVEEISSVVTADQNI
jgi:hypothetical protein